MKRIIALICCVVLVFTASLTSFAVNSPPNRIYAETVNAEAGEEVQIPVRISNNTGFMGFAILINYDPDVFTPVSVEGSDMLAGLVNDSIGTSSSGTFKVVYTGTANVTDDGELFTVALKTSSTVFGSKSIEITYSADDTFDEKWDPVGFSPESITVEFPEKPTTDPDDPPVEPDPQQPSEKLSVRISNRIATLKAPFNTILKVLLTPLIWVISLFE